MPLRANGLSAGTLITGTVAQPARVVPAGSVVPPGSVVDPAVVAIRARAVLIRGVPPAGGTGVVAGVVGVGTVVTAGGVAAGVVTVSVGEPVGLTTTGLVLPSDGAVVGQNWVPFALLEGVVVAAALGGVSPLDGVPVDCGVVLAGVVEAGVGAAAGVVGVGASPLPPLPPATATAERGPRAAIATVADTSNRLNLGRDSCWLLLVPRPGACCIRRLKVPEEPQETAQVAPAAGEITLERQA